MGAESVRGLHLHFDCGNGAAGDMALGALLDLGVPDEPVRDAIARVGVAPDRLCVHRVKKGGLAAVDVKIRLDDIDASIKAQEGARGEPHGHRHYREIRQTLAAAGVTPGVGARAGAIFACLARAEAKMHGCGVDEVAFHEVGALDALADIVGVAAALDWLAPVAVTAGSVAMGHGAIRCAHGQLPVPAPAALEILREVGAVISDGGADVELCTPTGAAILAASVTHWRAMPPMTPIAVGYGAGDSDFADRPNLLRIIAGRPEGHSAAGADEMVRLEANVDDMSPELCEHAADAIRAAGAVDVWWVPVFMKKGRPALQLSALAPNRGVAAVVDAFWRETTTIGVRFDRVERQVLPRAVATVRTAYGHIPVKVAGPSDAPLNVAPEHDACRAAALRCRVPLKEVYAAAMAAYRGGQIEDEPGNEPG